MNEAAPVPAVPKLDGVMVSRRESALDFDVLWYSELRQQFMEVKDRKEEEKEEEEEEEEGGETSGLGGSITLSRDTPAASTGV
ncbi:hypothetical protein B0A49_10248 [Cryomyces minteri]|uniref:Uncharacterized protein n=1 Tax=Cryomyces minteri TaxID=331657 RepID=A0A4U0X2R1_9PEZI|nr:hypothetical protein B0A49_10248 [Cryomyces minteri]